MRHEPTGPGGAGSISYEPHGEIGLLRDPRAWALLLAGMLTVMSNSTIAPALPGIEAMFRDTPNADLLTRLLVTAPSLMVALAASFAGYAADRFGRRNQLLVAAIVFAIAGTAGLYLPSLESILASRLLLGVAVAAIMTSQSALIGDYYTGIARARLMGYQVAMMNFAGFFFVMSAGGLAGISAVLPFGIYAISLPLLPLFFFVIKEPKHRAMHQAVALPGDEGQAGWKFFVGALSALIFVSFVLFYIVPTQIPFYLFEIGYTDATAGGWVLGGMMLSCAIFAVAFDRVRPVLGRGGTPALGYAMMAGGFAMFYLFHALPVLILAAALTGGAFGLMMPTFFTACLNAAPARLRGTAMGVFTTCMFFGQFASPLASQPVIANIGYENTFLLIAVSLGVIAVGVFFGLQERATSAIAQPAE
ncbi:MAG: MFS transporter [Rhodobiaceae bacterium]|nr:MFS transporter [Rhodobiaceae bacterium]MCC0056080.1 MFS transporter [Rhodobiaceae bacterium]